MASGWKSTFLLATVGFHDLAARFRPRDHLYPARVDFFETASDLRIPGFFSVLVYFGVETFEQPRRQSGTSALWKAKCPLLQCFQPTAHQSTVGHERQRRGPREYRPRRSTASLNAYLIVASANQSRPNLAVTAEINEVKQIATPLVDGLPRI